MNEKEKYLYRYQIDFLRLFKLCLSVKAIAKRKRKMPNEVKSVDAAEALCAKLFYRFITKIWDLGTVKKLGKKYKLLLEDKKLVDSIEYVRRNYNRLRSDPISIQDSYNELFYTSYDIISVPGHFPGGSVSLVLCEDRYKNIYTSRLDAKILYEAIICPRYSFYDTAIKVLDWKKRFDENAKSIMDSSDREKKLEKEAMEFALLKRKEQEARAKEEEEKRKARELEISRIRSEARAIARERREQLSIEAQRKFDEVLQKLG